MFMSKKYPIQGLLLAAKRSLNQVDQIPLSLVFGRTLTQANLRKEIPRPKEFLPSSLALLMNGGAAYLHEHCDLRHKQLGPIYREHLGPIDLVFLADTHLIRTVIANEGQYPHHNVPEAWLYYNKLNHVERGLFFQTGEPWLKIRRALNRVVLSKGTNINKYTSQILSINSDFLDHWESNNSSRPRETDLIIHEPKASVSKWSIEVMGSILFGTRMGCFNAIGERAERANRLVESVNKMFTETSKFQIMPVRMAHRLGLASWRRFSEASRVMLETATEYVDEQMTRLKSLGPSENLGLVGDILALNALSDDEISRSMVDLIIAAADTTSNSIQWMLYELSKSDQVQNKIRSEVEPLIKGESCEKLVDFLENAPYLRGFMKETLRLYPTAPFLARTLNKDILLDEYLVPAGLPIVFSLYTTSRSEFYFESPLEFKPERWIRSEQQHQKAARSASSNFASLPFGLGARMCVGRRAAELEMGLFISSLVTRYSIVMSNDDGHLVKPKLRMILCPDRPISFRLTPR